ncbi:phage tail protein [Mesorhizobium sp. SB112]|uniref:COG4223 family protein n=1 Tax=Mesorhizobium sp. SB112 TaxID=3151853 RepID=UPI003266A037
MVKTPRTRHSRPKRDPVTIELEPDAVSRISDSPPAEADAQEAAAQAAETPEEAAISQSDSPNKRDETGQTGNWQPTTSSDYDFSANSDNAAQPVTDDAAAEREETRAEESESPYAPSGAEPAAERKSMSPFLAALAGGVSALVLAGLLQFAGVLGSPGSSGGQNEAVSQEIASLKSQIADLSRGENGPDLSNRVDALTASLQEVRSNLETVRGSAEAGTGGVDLSAIEGRIGEIESSVTRLGEAGGQPNAEAVTALDGRIAAAEALVKTETERVSSLDARIAGLEQTMTGVSDKLEAQAGQPKIALSIAASALKSAVERGAPFQAEIETFAAIAPDAPELADLRGYAEKGVTTRADIATETDQAANAMIAAAAPPLESASFLDRLMVSAESLVKVRPVGAVEGAGVPETVARMEVAINGGDLQKAISEYDTLPEAAKTAGAAFAEKIRARIAVEGLVDKMVAGAMRS